MKHPETNSAAGLGLVVPRLGAFRRFISDPQAALWKKLIFALVLVYIAFPADFVPDFIPFWGWLDDLGAGTLGAVFLSWALRPYSGDAPRIVSPVAEPNEPND